MQNFKAIAQLISKKKNKGGGGGGGCYFTYVDTDTLVELGLRRLKKKQLIIPVRVSFGFESSNLI